LKLNLKPGLGWLPSLSKKVPIGCMNPIEVLIHRQQSERLANVQILYIPSVPRNRKASKEEEDCVQA
jgi:hypothetical protein